MAYSRKRSTRKTSYRRTARTTARPRRRASSTARRTTARGRGGSAARTVRIVIEQASANPIQRPDLGLMAEPRKRKPAFV